MLLCGFGLPRVAAQKAGAEESRETARLAWYAYDAALPLNAVLKPMDTSRVSTRYRLDYDSVHDQRVSAIYSLPKGYSGPYPTVLLVHGSGGHKDTSYIKAVGQTLASVGYATLALDTQYHGDRSRPGRGGEIHMPNSFTMRDAWVQSVIDLRRAVDYLQTRPDVDHSRLGYLGFSQGAMLGAVFGGVDMRVGTFCLAVPGGDLMAVIRHIDRYPLLKSYWPTHTTPEMMTTAEAITNITDPIHYIGRIAPRPLFILSAKYDEIIPAEASQAIIAAARSNPNLKVMQIVSGHVLNPTVLFPIRDFFREHMGKRERIAGR